MIIDEQTNFVYLADCLPDTYPAFAKDLVEQFSDNGIPFGFLPETKGAWAVDYMPIQVSENKFVRFLYKPDYLISASKWSKTISDVDTVCEKIGIKTIKSNINLDGGNISKWKNRVLITTKVFLENRTLSELDLIEQLKNILEVNEIIFVPVEKDDWLGHADGMARFIDADTVLINEYKHNNPVNYIDFLSALHNAKLSWKTMPFTSHSNKDPDDAAGLYLNYLELENHVFLPTFNQESDQLAIDRIKELFPLKKIIPILGTQPAKDTGVINCLTWNIRK
ncbi:agmatine deiminase family protein [Algoriphagus sp. D3-2-R+10]|uniref:agmatine deiminase family protein n=1 Tax=Algoriphagus aurantiacus TaxID=3103948 RepID=UPI002B3F74DF|nr:agmatine deiminase family protein [Algoriphagus sp. D3-2-R+10]MEB2777629.1 agmatine deiminase family protein [Algoriphagus sp. D3-2-R+10]